MDELEKFLGIGAYFDTERAMHEICGAIPTALGVGQQIHLDIEREIAEHLHQAMQTPTAPIFTLEAIENAQREMQLWGEAIAPQIPIPPYNLTQALEISHQNAVEAFAEIERRECQVELHEGMRVRPNPESEHYGIWNHQHKFHGEDCEGTILKLDHVNLDNNWWRVKWDNGNGENNYTTDYLIPIDPMEIEEGEEMKFQEGTRVQLNPNYHGDNKRYWDKQSEGSNGTVVSFSGSSLKIQWDNGHENYYSSDYVIPLEEEVEVQTGEPSIYDCPFLVGTRVCLNPEWEDYEDYNNAVKGTAGYITKSNISDDRLKRWLHYPVSTRKNVTITVRFDNDKELVLRISNILPIDAPTKNVTLYQFNNGKMICFDDDIKDNARLDQAFIIDKWHLSSKIYYNDEWRKGIMDAIENPQEEGVPRKRRTTPPPF